jgi:hypothetical protein
MKFVALLFQLSLLWSSCVGQSSVLYTSPNVYETANIMVDELNSLFYVFGTLKPAVDPVSGNVTRQKQPILEQFSLSTNQLIWRKVWPDCALCEMKDAKFAPTIQADLSRNVVVYLQTTVHPVTYAAIPNISIWASKILPASGSALLNTSQLGDASTSFKYLSGDIVHDVFDYITYAFQKIQGNVSTLYRSDSTLSNKLTLPQDSITDVSIFAAGRDIYNYLVGLTRSYYQVTSLFNLYLYVDPIIFETAGPRVMVATISNSLEHLIFNASTLHIFDRRTTAISRSFAVPSSFRLKAAGFRKFANTVVVSGDSSSSVLSNATDAAVSFLPYALDSISTVSIVMNATTSWPFNSATYVVPRKYDASKYLVSVISKDNNTNIRIQLLEFTALPSSSANSVVTTSSLLIAARYYCIL